MKHLTIIRVESGFTISKETCILAVVACDTRTDTVHVMGTRAVFGSQGTHAVISPELSCRLEFRRWKRLGLFTQLVVSAKQAVDSRLCKLSRKTAAANALDGTVDGRIGGAAWEISTLTEPRSSEFSSKTLEVRCRVKIAYLIACSVLGSAGAARALRNHRRANLPGRGRTGILAFASVLASPGKQRG